MSERPWLLDLYCGAGGAAMGYHRAGFDVVGVDIAPQPNYPFRFEQADALDYLAHLGSTFMAVHASPPCQAHTSLRHMWNARDHGDLIGPTRRALLASGLPWVIENVVGAPLIDPVTVCGSSLGCGTGRYTLRRHRLFESSFPLMVPPCAHGRRRTLGVFGDALTDATTQTAQLRAGGPRPREFSSVEALALAREAMGMPWATWRELTQAIPPAYTELVGWQMLAAMEVAA